MEKSEPKAKISRRPKEGDIFAIPLGGDVFGFCQVARNKSYAFFDLRGDLLVPTDEIVLRPVLFRIPVAQDVAKKGGWQRLGNLPLTGPLAEPASFWSQPVGSNSLEIVKDNTITPATIDQIQGLERMAWWFEHHIVERLNDHFAGRSNTTLDSLNKIAVYDPITGQEIVDAN